MKQGSSARAAATTLDQAIDDSRRGAEIDGDSPPRRGRSVSEAVVSQSVAMFDAVAILSAGAIAMSWDRSAVDWRLEGLIVLLGTLLASHLLRLAGAHRFANLADVGSSVGRALLGWLLTLAVLFAATYVLEPVTAADGPWVMLWFSLGVVALIVSRSLLSRQMRSWSRAGRLGEVVAIVGAGSIAQRLLRHLNGTPTGPRIFGVYDDEFEHMPRRCMGHAILGSVDDLVEMARRNAIDTVIVALPPTSEHALVETLNKLSAIPVDVRLCPSEFALRLGTLEASHIGGHTFLNVIDRPLRDWRWIAKAIEDRLLAAAILLAISPALLVIAILVRLDSPGPILFRQKRHGFNNELIEMLKFRTMYHEMSDVKGEQLTRRDDPRITRIGAFLRRTSLDELPQFLNVLRGDMSIVGPRPHAPAAKAGALLYTEAVKHYDARHRVKPGITGWAQVNGWRGETNTLEQIRKRVEHDLYYIEHWSIALDLQIIARTIATGFTGRNAF
ncbi:undecaprenyl-phosphate glucose phosphotransferase [Reyranella sp.]|uniref:undecaprenyl-phosphate glucose phosphotransferase n=1 Tax=Reyranella sp. TaxID=1929291 RepID=UPI003D0C29DA